MRAWLAEYREAHANDDPDAVHVQVRRLGRPGPQHPDGCPGWLPQRQLKPALDDSGSYLVVRARTATLRVGGKTVQLSYGTRLPVVSGNRVRTPDGVGTISGAALPLA